MINTRRNYMLEYNGWKRNAQSQGCQRNGEAMRLEKENKDQKQEQRS